MLDKVLECRLCVPKAERVKKVMRFFRLNFGVVQNAGVSFAFILFGLMVGQGRAQVFVINEESRTGRDVQSYGFDGARINSSLISRLDDPVALASDGQGHLFVACLNYGLGYIGEYNLDGTPVNRRLIQNLPGPSYFALDGKGHIFVTGATRRDHFVNEYNLDGTFVRQVVTTTYGYSPRGLAADSNGHLFLGLESRVGDDDGIAEYSVEGGLINWALVRGLQYPADLTLDANQRLLVVNMASGTVGEYTTLGETINARLISGLDVPDYIATDGCGNIFVSHYGGRGGEVKEYSADGAIIHASLISGLHGPIAVVAMVPEPGVLGIWLAGIAMLTIVKAGNRNRSLSNRADRR